MVMERPSAKKDEKPKQEVIYEYSELPTIILEDEMSMTDENLLKYIHRIQDRIKAIRETRREGMSQEEQAMTPAQKDNRARELEDLERQWAANLGKGKMKKSLYDTSYTF